MPPDNHSFLIQDQYRSAKNVLSCRLCTSPSFIAYRSLHDRLFGSPGEWSLAQCANPDCELLWIYPQPSEKQTVAAYQTYYTHDIRIKPSIAKALYYKLRLGYLASRYGYKQGETGLGWKLIGRIAGLIPHRRDAFNASVMWLPAKPQGRLLEIGCGNGERLTFLKELGWDTQGVEPDPKAAAIALAMGHQITVRTFVSELFPKESFDAILMSHVIEHVEDPRETVQECVRLLSPKGHLIILTPNTRGLGHRWYGKDWFPLDPPRHLNLFNRSAMLKMLDGLGLTEIQCDSIIRDVKWVLAGSYALKIRGSYSFGSLPVLWRIYGLLLLYVEWFNLMLDHDSGEELLVIARK